MTENQIIVNQTINEVVVSSPGPQGPRGKTILNGAGVPANNLGLQGDFYFNTLNNDFYGPKLSDLTWDAAKIIRLVTKDDIAYQYTWELAQVHSSDQHSSDYHVIINHNLGFSPNVTVKSSAGDVLETGIDYNSLNSLTLTMAQPFSGTAYLS